MPKPLGFTNARYPANKTSAQEKWPRIVVLDTATRGVAKSFGVWTP